MARVSTLLAVDAATLYFRAFYGVPSSVTAPDGTPVNAVRGLLDMIARLSTDYQATHLVACWDDDWRPQWRVDLIPTYKAHRVAQAVPGGTDIEVVPEGLEAQLPMIRRVLERQMQWSVFEPNNSELRDQLARMIEAYLRELYRANAFTGASEAQAFFVKCDDELNPQAVVDQGQLLAQVGIAPAEPMEFIVLNIARSADAALAVEA